MSEPNGDMQEELRTYCTTPVDFLTPESKDMIGRLLTKWLNETCITPTELVCLAANQKRLELAGMTRRNAIDRAAGAQAKAAKGLGSERIKELTDLVGDLYKMATRFGAWGEDHQVTPETLDDVVAASASAAEAPQECEAFAFAAISTSLAAVNKWPDKIERLLDMAETCKSPDAQRLIETLMFEILSNPEAIQVLMQHPDTWEALLHSLADVADGAKPLPPAMPPVLTRLQKTIQTRKLTLARAGLIESMVRLVSERQALTVEFETTPANDDSRISELRAINGFNRRILASKAKLMNEDLAQAFEVRLTRVFTPEAMSDMLQGRPVNIQADLLGTFQKYVFGARCKGLVDGQVSRMFIDDRFPDKLLDVGGEAMDRIGRLGRAAATTLGSGMTDSDKQEVVRRLEAAQHGIIRKENVFGRINSGPQTNTAKGLTMLDMCRNAHFIPGRNKELAVKLTRHYLAQSDFLAGYLQGAQGAEREKKMALLKRRLKEAGIS